MRPFAVAATVWELALGCHSAANAPSAPAAPPTLADVPAIEQVVQEYRARLFEPDGLNLTLGRACGYGPSPPPAFHWINFLVAARATDALRDAALNAPTLEGQLWALIGLLRAGQLDPDAFDQALATVDEPVWFCDGCIAEQTDASTAIEELLPILPPLR